ncbi:acyl-CoA thioesterase II [Microbacterium soli]|uniref:acyl-CoA thioesterase n=1 Tax=Microbacterium soli TaxID=446075 RepID=UPI0031D7125D
MTAQNSADRSVRNLLRVLDLDASEARTTEDIFTGISHPMPTGRVYGGQVLAQSLVAAERTLPEERIAHSMHGYFLRPGDATAGITFAVDRIHDGRSFSTRRVQAYQGGVPIFSMISSFQDEDPGVEHAQAMPDDVPAPESLPSDDELIGAVPTGTGRLLAERSADIRHVTGALHLEVAGERVPQQAVWMRMRSPLPDDPRLHRAALAYLSDMTIQESILRRHGITWQTPGLKVASLDHAMWWHRFGRADEWMLYVQHSPSARGGRGLGQGRVYSRDGTLLATVAQEIMVRVPEL